MYFEEAVLEDVDCISFWFADQGFVSVFNMLIEQNTIRYSTTQQDQAHQYSCTLNIF